MISFLGRGSPVPSALEILKLVWIVWSLKVFLEEKGFKDPFCVHLLFDCVFASKYWFRLLQAFNFCWVFYHVFKNNVSQILAGPDLKKKTAECLWANAVKTHLAEIWFERNQRVFHNKSPTWMERYDSACLNASSWCSLSKYFSGLSFAGDCFKLVSLYSLPTLKF